MLKTKQESFDSPEYWEKILEAEWLWDLDVIEWFREKVNDILEFKNEKTFYNFIKDFEEKNNLKVMFDNNNASISFFEKETSRKIWFIRPWHYSYNWLEKSSHLEKVIEPDYRWKGFWKKLIEIFVNYWKLKWYKNFLLPKNEYSHKLSSISLFVKYFWYEITWKFIDWERIEVDDYEFDRIYLRWVDDLDFTYELTRNK